MMICVPNCLVKSLDEWSEGFLDELRMSSDGIFVLPHRATTPTLLGPWRDIGFGTTPGVIVCSKLTGRVSATQPVIISFQYLRGGTPSLCEVRTRRVGDALRILHGFEQFLGRSLSLEEPSAWPLPELTFASRTLLYLYTPTIRTSFKLLSKFNVLAMEVLVAFGLVRMSSQLSFEFVTSRIPIRAWYIITRFRGATLFWIGLQRLQTYLHLWQILNRVYRSVWAVSRKVGTVVPQRRPSEPPGTPL